MTNDDTTATDSAMTGRILHLIPDEHKFSSYIFDYFENLYPGRNEFLLNQTNKEILHQHAAKFHFAVSVEDFVSCALRLQKNTDIVIAHGLWSFTAMAVNQFPESTPIGWCVFGGEVFNSRIKMSVEWVSPKTKAFVKQTRQATLANNIRDVLRLKPTAVANTLGKGLKKLRLKRSKPSKVPLAETLQAFSRINVIAATLPQDYKFIKSEFQLSASHVWFSYYNIQQTVGADLIESRISGNDILVGNSSDPTNLHLESFDVIAGYEENFDRIVVPLSYGSADYGKAVGGRGQDIFGDRLEALFDFMPRDEYNRILLRCRFAILNHRRQQAFGTTVTLLWLGSKVFLNETSTTYQYLKDLGMAVYPVSSFQSEVKKTLTDLEFKNNRSILSAEFSQARVSKGASNLAESLFNMNTEN